MDSPLVLSVVRKYLSIPPSNIHDSSTRQLYLTHHSVMNSPVLPAAAAAAAAAPRHRSVGSGVAADAGADDREQERTDHAGDDLVARIVGVDSVAQVRARIGVVVDVGDEDGRLGRVEPLGPGGDRLVEGHDGLVVHG